MDGDLGILFNDSRFGKAVKHIGSNNDNMVVVEQLLHNFQPEVALPAPPPTLIIRLQICRIIPFLVLG